ncbi:hypothetical protein [Spirosoma endophyticum]|uniref:Uncharacterized protein n=1 Tax=Spirosoma endophyticum TaxID=662367 RepID=A0A1I1MTM2_9BACT|nr:hypothetical protein [Spirosoma endophyticum]SFC88252.1 hypothetical protein SAMN05216167_102691 [Spirosoma endophyticum]
MKALLILPITALLLIVFYAERDLLSRYQVSTTMAVLLLLLVDALVLWFSLVGIKLAVWAAHRLLNRAEVDVMAESVSKEEYQEV